jgi:hypothetical protein
LIEKKSFAIQTKGMARVKPSQLPVLGSRSRLRGSVQGGAGKTVLALGESGSKKLCGALKDAARVTPSSDREWNQEVEFHDAIYRERPG